MSETRPIWEVIIERANAVPDEEAAKVPRDLSSIVGDPVGAVMEARDIIADLVNQACSDEDGTLDSMALGTYAEAIRYLARVGKVRITSEYGRRVLAEWV